jgi:putative membrane protein
MTMFYDLLIPFYLWIKAFHIIAVIAWMAGLLYLPRLFVYHCEVAPGSAEAERFKRMEQRLLGIIIRPAMGVAWLFGLLLVFLGGFWDDGWMYGKFALVIAMSAFSGVFARWTKEFAADANKRSQRFYRLMNEVPAVLMILIVLLVVVKPF